MASLVLIAIILSIILYKLYIYVFTKPKNFPPGPPRIPFFGGYLFILLMNYNHIHRGVDRLCRFYKTNILGFYYGSYLTIVANDLDSVKEVINKTEYDGRPALLLAQLRDPKLNPRGIFFIDGPHWKEQRRFTMRHFRDFGFGRRFEELESEIQDEIIQFMDMVKTGPKYPHETEVLQNGNIHCPAIFSLPFVNAFLKVLINERLPRSEQHILVKTCRGALRFQRNGDDYGRLFSLINWTKDYFPNLTGYKECKEGSDILYSFAKKIADEQCKSYNDHNERHYLDLYFKEMIKAREDKIENSFNFDQLVMLIWDFLLPVFTATPATITFLLQRIILQPEVLTKMQKEIDEVVGHGRLPHLDDKINLPYTEASIREILRMQTVVASGVAHRAEEAGTLGGYDVPQGTVILTGLQSAHLDPKKFPDPHEFKPERFLDKSGKLSLKQDITLPFGAGRRLCAGETFARNLLFLMMTALAQNFNIKAPVGHKIPDPYHETITGVILTTPDFWVHLEPR